MLQLKWTALLTGLMILALVAVACGGNTAEPPAPPASGTGATAGSGTGTAPSSDSGTTAAPADQPTAAMPASDAAMPASDEPFRIGVMESLTGPGETYGTVAVQAKQMAVNEINAAGGINGRMLRLMVEDSKCAAQDAITAYNKLTEVDGVKIILGTSCSGAMLGAAPLAEADGVVLFSGLATNPDIANAGDFIFRTSMSDLQLGIDTGNVLWADGVRTLATITETTDYAEGVRRTTVDQFEKLGGEVVAEERYASDVTDFRSQLTKLINANPDAIHIAAQGEFSGGTVVKQLRELGYAGALYSEIVPVGATALEVAGDSATGLKAITAELDPANPKAQEVLTNFRAEYDYVTLPWYLGSAYDDVYIAAECLKMTNDDQDAAGFRDCMYQITWSGAIGEGYSFDAMGEVVGLSNVVVQVLPLSERTADNQGYRVLGPAGSDNAVTAMPAAGAMSQEPFRIGAMDALTGVGESYGNPILNAKLLAVTEINAAGGINGRMLEIIPEDSKCAAQDAITAYNKLTDVDGVKIILGTTCSGAMLGAAPLAEAEGVILLSASATNPDIATAGDYIFRTAINDNQLGIDTGNALASDDIHHLATITETTDYAEGARRTTVARFEELGGHVVAEESYASDVTDFRTQLTKLINAEPDAVYLASQGEFSGGTIVKQLRELGFDGPIYTESVNTGPEALGIAGDAATGMKAIIPLGLTERGEQFLKDYEAHYGNPATQPWFQASAYDDVYLTAECLRQVNDDQDSAGVRDCLYNVTFTGAIGNNYTFDSDGEVVGLGNVVVRILPLAERTEDNLGYEVLGPAPAP